MLKYIYLAIVAFLFVLVAVNMFRKEKNFWYQVDAALVMITLLLRLLLIKQGGDEDEEKALKAQKYLNVPSKFRLYTNSDVIGVELGGSLKNVIAIASGFASEMGLGDNCRGALLTRGMAEIVRVSVALGAHPATLYGLSGMGDLIATCSSPLSRNYTVGSMLGKGKKIDDILRELGSVAEGVKTSKAVCELAKKLNIEVPVSSAIYEAVYTDITPKEVLDKLMNRKLKAEEEL